MPAAGERSHYQVLGVSPTASVEEIRRAHRQLARLLHPDRQAGATPAERALAERRMREVNAAWTTLSDPVQRAAYDSRSAQRSSTTARGGPARATSPRPSGPREATQRGVGGEPDPGSRGQWNSVEDDDDVELGAGHIWLFRRGPVIAMLAVGLFLFVATAYAGGNAISDVEGDTDAAVTTSKVPAVLCVRRIEGRTAVLVDCASTNDGRLVTLVEQALDCPARTSYVVLDGRFACVTTDPTVTSDGVPTTID